MAQRSVNSTLKNEGRHDLSLDSVELDHGIWSALGQPPARIAQGTEARWGSESNGFMTGTEGTAIYSVGTTGAKLKVYWDNPFIGDNTFTQELVPATGGGPGVPDYVAFDPMRPNHVKTPLEPVQFESGSDIEITYRFQQGPAEEASVVPTAAASPDPGEPRTPTAPANTPTTVQDPAAPRRLIYIGFTSTSALHEEKSLSKHVGAGGMISITSGNHSWVLRDSDFESRTQFIPADRREKLKALEQAKDLIEWTHDAGVTKTIDPKLRLFALRSLAAAFGRCDPDLNPSADTSFAKRLCISGHHCYQYTNERQDVLWGDNFPSCTLTLFTEGGNHGILQGLADIFPKAFLNVEDLMLSACNLGQSFLKEPPKLFDLFKNLKTIWAYEGSSPAPSDSRESRVSQFSSTAGILAWETTSRRPGAAEDIKKACKDVRNKGGGPCVMWVDRSYVKHESK